MTEAAAKPESGPAPGAAMPALHPRLAAVLEPGEEVIRTGRGKGLSLTLAEGVILGIVVLAFGSWGVQTLGAALAGQLAQPALSLIMTALVLAFIGQLAWSVAARPDGAHYALTGRRRLFREHRLIPIPLGWFVWSLSGQKIMSHTRIREVTVTGTKTRGRIKLRDVTWSSEPSVTLTGVDNPLELAELIRTTLKLDMAVQDYTA